MFECKYCGEFCDGRSTFCYNCGEKVEASDIYDEDDGSLEYIVEDYGDAATL